MTIEIKHKFTGAVLHLVEGDTLTDADLRYANLTGADLRYANLRGADLRYADLTDAIIFPGWVLMRKEDYDDWADGAQ